MLLLALLTIASQNELVLAFSDEGTAALTRSGATFRVIGPKQTTTFDLAGTALQCKTRALELQRAARGFTGVEISVRGCGKASRDAIVRTLKRHADEAAASDRGDVVIEGDAAVVDGVRFVIAELAKRRPLRAAISPTKRLVLLFARNPDGGATVVFAANDARAIGL